MIFKTAFISKAGGRESNQDFCGNVSIDDKNKHCWVITDGLGSHRGGERASKIVVNKIIELFKNSPEITNENLEYQLIKANEEIVMLQAENDSFSDMKTTVIEAICDNENLVCGHIGDSRFYHFRENKLFYQTLDHSVPQTMVTAGELSFEEIRKHPDRNRLLRSMGNKEGIKPSFYSSKIIINDKFLFCTDGFWEYVTEIEMEFDLAKSETPEMWLEEMELRLLKKVKNDFDNYSAIAVFISPF